VRGLGFFLFPMMFNHAPRGSAQNGMMTGNMANHAAYDGAFDAAFCAGRRGKESDASCNDEKSSEMAHFHFSAVA
jgi:hypothetical protein